MNIGPVFDITIALGLLVLWTLAARGLARGIELVPREIAGDQRAAALDGLRGFLALSVIVHHAAIHRLYWPSGQWREPASLVFSWLGPAPVALFFMLTGFLFWSKALHGHRAEPMKLWVGRVRRIVPMYLFAGLVTLSMFAALQSGIANPFEDWVSDLISVVSGGFVEFPLWRNQIHSIPLNAGVTWTLQYEWYFYLALPVLALRATPQATVVMAVVCACLAASNTVAGIAWFNFSLGMLAAVIRSRGTVPAWVRGVPGLLLCVACVGLLGLGSGRQTVGSSLAMGVLFVTVACGQDLKGLLISQPARWLGTISYSVYLMHGIVLYVVLRRANSLAPIGSLSDVAYWLLIAGAGLLTVLLSAVTYSCIERPFIQTRPAAVVQVA
jgi:peptidoglycan/LPS O-acetylase OafA/YrhL